MDQDSSCQYKRNWETGIFKGYYPETVASCGYSQTVLSFLWLFRKGCSAVPRGAEGRREHRMRKMYSGGGTIATTDLQGLGFFNCEKNQYLWLLLEVITGRSRAQSSWAAVCLCADLFSHSFTMCLLLHWVFSELSKRHICPTLVLPRVSVLQLTKSVKFLFCQHKWLLFCSATGCNSFSFSGHKWKVVSIHL